MKKIALLVLSLVVLTGCASVKKAQNLSDCTYALKSVEVTDYDITSIGFVVTIAITNPNKKRSAGFGNPAQRVHQLAHPIGCL